MALLERSFPVQRQSVNFFDRFVTHMQQEFADMDKEMARMRQQMFQLVPMGICDDVREAQIQPSLPVVEERGTSKLKLEFDVHTFKPEEVVVKVVGSNILQIEAKHEEKSETSHEVHKFFRQYQLPVGVEADTLKPTLTQDGVLTIEAAAPALKPEEKMIPIEYKKT